MKHTATRSSGYRGDMAIDLVRLCSHRKHSGFTCDDVVSHNHWHTQTRIIVAATSADVCAISTCCMLDKYCFLETKRSSLLQGEHRWRITPESALKSTSYMFWRVPAFNQDLSNWKWQVASTSGLNKMFRGCCQRFNPAFRPVLGFEAATFNWQ